MEPYLDQLLAYTSLPNLHPAVVHFPIALVLTAVALDVLCLFVRRYVWMDRAATALFVLGAMGAGLAYLSGQQAARSLGGIPGTAVESVVEHRELALYTLGALALTAILRVLVTRLGRFDTTIHLGFFRLVALIVSLGAAGLIVVTADHGGTLVYHHGLGVGIERNAPNEGE